MRFLCNILVLALVGVQLSAETKTFSTVKEGTTTTSTQNVVETAEGENTRVVFSDKDGSSSALVARDGQVLSYEVKAKEGNYILTWDRKFLTSKGLWEGKPISGKTELKGLGFYGQGFEFALRTFVAGRAERLLFPMVDFADPNLSYRETELTYDGRGSFQGKTVPRIRVGLTGFASLFWSAHFLVNSKGDILEYAGNSGPGTPDMVTSLVPPKS